MEGEEDGLLLAEPGAPIPRGGGLLRGELGRRRIGRFLQARPPGSWCFVANAVAQRVGRTGDRQRTLGSPLSDGDAGEPIERVGRVHPVPYLLGQREAFAVILTRLRVLAAFEDDARQAVEPVCPVALVAQQADASQGIFG